LEEEGQTRPASGERLKEAIRIDQPTSAKVPHVIVNVPPKSRISVLLAMAVIAVGTFASIDAGSGTIQTTGTIQGGTVNADNFTEHEYNFQANSNATDNTYYCFRLSNGGTALNNYSVYAEVQVIPTGPTTDQVMRHGNWFSGGVEQSFFWAD
jgi:hypothetical protein